MVLGTNIFPFYKFKFISIYQLAYERKQSLCTLIILQCTNNSFMNIFKRMWSFHLDDNTVILIYFITKPVFYYC